MKDVFNLKHSATTFGERPAVVADGGQEISYLDVWHNAETIAVRLVQLGVSASTHWVAVEPHKDVESVLTILTLVSLGIPFVVLHPAWSDEQKHAVLQETRALLVPIESTPLGAMPKYLPANAYTKLERQVALEDPLCVVYTSGTSGNPKGVILSRRAFLASSEEARTWLRLVPNDRWFLSLPLAHVGGLSVLARCWLAHASIVVHSTSRTSFSPRTFLAALEQTQATLVSLVPTQVQRVCSDQLTAPQTLRLVLLGGAAAPTALVERALRHGFRVVRTYGLTELCSIVATQPVPAEGEAKEQRATQDLMLHGHITAQLATDGRLMLRGDSLFSGYWGLAPQAPAQWFTTEDLAELDGRRVHILGRADDIIVTGGEKVHPARVEGALFAFPGVSSACVFGRSSDEWGQEVCAALVTEAGFSLDDLLSHLRARLPSFNIPRAWVFVTQLPTNATGKVHRLTVARELGPLCQHIQSHTPRTQF